MGAIESVFAAGKQYVEAYKETEKFRQAWDDKTKDDLLKNLKFIADGLEPLGILTKMGVTSGSTVKNLGAVRLSFYSAPYGLIQKNESGSKSFTRRGGSLIYQQRINGRIIAAYSLPYIDFDGEEDKSVTTLGTYQPEELTEDCISEHVRRFLEEVLLWHNSN